MQREIIKNIFYYTYDCSVRREKLMLTRVLSTLWNSDIDNIKEYI